MTAVLGVAQLIDQNEVSEGNRKLLQTLNSSGQHLLRLIDDVLDLSKAEQGPLTLKQDTFAPESLLEETVALLQPVARQKGLQLDYQAGRLPAHVKGDCVRLRQVFTNLVANALKYTEHGDVTINVTSSQSQNNDLLLAVSVKDSGIGIALDRQQQIFQPFEQIDSSDRRRQGGAGLGLAICKQLVDAMGGSIGVESVPGKGSRFWFEIPLQLGAPQETEVASSLLRPAPMRILLVDDVAANRRIVGQLLSFDGHKVSVAENGLSALEVISNDTFDLVLLDIQMPDMDGFEVFRRMQDNQPSPPVIALTASTGSEMTERCRDAGMIGLISKPLRINELYETLAEHGIGGFTPLTDEPEVRPEDPLASYRKYLSEDELANFLVLQQQTLNRLESDMLEAWESNHLAAVAKAAHQIAGIAGISSAKNRFARQLEDNALAGDTEAVAVLIEQYKSAESSESVS